MRAIERMRTRCGWSESDRTPNLDSEANITSDITNVRLIKRGKPSRKPLRTPYRVSLRLLQIVRDQAMKQKSAERAETSIS